MVPTFWRNIKIKANRNPFKFPFFYWLNKNNSVKKMKKGFKEHSKCALKETVAFFYYFWCHSIQTGQEIKFLCFQTHFLLLNRSFLKKKARREKSMWFGPLLDSHTVFSKRTSFGGLHHFYQLKLVFRPTVHSALIHRCLLSHMSFFKGKKERVDFQKTLSSVWHFSTCFPSNWICDAFEK